MTKVALPGLLQPLSNTSEFSALVAGLAKGLKQQMVIGLTGSQRGLVMAGLAQAGAGPALIITTGEAEATALVDDLTELLPQRQVMFFPVWQSMAVEVFSRYDDVANQRLRVLETLVHGGVPIVIAPIEALMRRLVPATVYRAGRIEIALGQRVNLADLQQFFVQHGYQREALITAPGQFSIRGGIIDLYPASSPHPVRIELWDDEVDSLRTFDLTSQRSLENIEQIEIPPARELVLAKEQWETGRKNLQDEYRQHSKKMHQTASVDAQHQLSAQVETWLNRLATPAYYEGIEQLLPYFYPRPGNLLDYLPPGVPVLVDDPIRMKDLVEVIQKEGAETHTDLLAKGKVLPTQYQIYLQWPQLLAELAQKQAIYFSALPRHPKFLQPQNIVSLQSKTMHSFLGNTDALVDEINHWRRQQNAVVIMMATPERAHHLLTTLNEQKIAAFYTAALTDEVIPGNVVVTTGQLASGLELPAAQLVLITEQDIFGHRRKTKAATTKTNRRATAMDDLDVGDYVVHINHGIGRYQGITTLDVGEVQRDYLVINYRGDDRVYIPTDQVSMLQRYLGKEGTRPKLSKLGGNEWVRAKNKVQKAVQEIARDLIVLYAQRQSLKGYAYHADSLWQKEFEGGFPYQETPDQLRAITDVKEDLESSQPMDRLLCGDVGYGKTEVALRAAFKVVNDGKQVAILVPTTILAQQHYNTFRDRFAPYPIKIAMLSRFRTPKEQRAVLKGLATGTVDVVIGTHRLISDDVDFKDLGLLVVDEEQRFGVMHKERLKQLRTTVDVLTLTATPIPRTLHMSLVGVRDTSLLETPPEDRFPVQTYILEEDEAMIREAVRREINRGGQVFYVHNRVTELDRVARWLQGLVPEARIIVAHGQMKEEALEKTMLDYMDGHYDVLVCTTIVETGLDIPNVNTLIIKDADRFGLAQLYQLRGRVGRTNRLAYAYLTFRRDKVLSEEAEKRLSSIREFTELGSGYKIALRDLEIRGAGNILGAEQHGHIAEVGFDLYCQMLDQAIKEARGEQKEAPVETLVELPVDAYIPEKYISNASQKVDVYRRIARIDSEAEIEDLADEMIDRYGDLPASVIRLLMVASIRVLANQLKVTSISRQYNQIRFLFGAEPPLDGSKLVKLMEVYKNGIKYHEDPEGFEIKLKLRTASRVDVQALKKLSRFLKELGAGATH